MPRGGDDTENLEDLLLDEELILDQNPAEVELLNPEPGIYEWRRSDDAALHHETEPARTIKKGKKWQKEWFWNDKRHREGDVPALVDSAGNIKYYKHGLLDRKVGAAVISPDGREEYWLNGSLDRPDNLPAIIYTDPSVVNNLGAPVESYYIKGVCRRDDGGPCEIWSGGSLTFYDGYNKQLCCHMYFIKDTDGHCELWLTPEKEIGENEYHNIRQEGIPVASTRGPSWTDLYKEIIYKAIAKIAPDFVEQEGENIFDYFESLLQESVAKERKNP